MVACLLKKSLRIIRCYENSYSILSPSFSLMCTHFYSFVAANGERRFNEGEKRGKLFEERR